MRSRSSISSHLLGNLSATVAAQPVVDSIAAKPGSPVAMTWGLVQDSIGLSTVCHSLTPFASFVSRVDMFFHMWRARMSGYFVPGDEWMTDRNGNYEESVAPSEDAGDRLRGASQPFRHRRVKFDTTSSIC